MMSLLVFMFVLLNSENLLVTGVDLSYDDLIKVNASCSPFDSCKVERPEDSPGIPVEYSCSCDRNCSLFGSCCIDSPYKDNSVPIMECRNTGDPSASIGYYMVSRCGSDTQRNSIWKHLCEAEWNKEDDITKLAPVSSGDTFTTYKNYFCFRCHETTDKFQYWKLNIASNFNDSEKISQDSDFSVVYNKKENTWIATTIKEAISIPVTLQFRIPDGLSILPLSCKLGIVSGCPDTWRDQNTRDKCTAYTAVVYTKYSHSLKYKNPHCAFCNFESLSNISCKPYISVGFQSKRLFDFSQLLPFPASSSKSESRCGQNQVWDPYAKRCRNLVCALPGYELKDGRCTPP